MQKDEGVLTVEGEEGVAVGGELKLILDFFFSDFSTLFFCIV